jgi:hypothetical protein
LLIAKAARPLTLEERDALWESEGFPEWEYVPFSDGHPYEWKPSDWGWLDGRLVALDYATPAYLSDEEEKALHKSAETREEP